MISLIRHLSGNVALKSTAAYALVGLLSLGLLSQLGCSGSDNPSGPEDPPPPPEEPTGYIGPRISVNEPARASIIEGGSSEASPVLVSGLACDDVHDLVSINVGGIDVPPVTAGSCRDFGFEHSSRLGLNVIHGTAVNTQGQVGSVAHSFLRSPGFFPASVNSDAAARAVSGLYMGIGQEFLDDDDRGDLDDIVTIVNHALDQMDFDAIIGDFRFAEPDANGDGEIDAVSYDCFAWTEWNRRDGFRVRKNSPFTHDGIRLRSLEFVDGGLIAEVVMTNGRIGLEVNANADAGCLGDTDVDAYGDARLPGDAVVTSRATIAMGPNGVPELNFYDTQISANLDLDISIDLGWLADFLQINWLAGEIASSLADEFDSVILGESADAVEGVLNDVLPGLIAGFGVNESITLPEPFSTTIVFESGFDAVSVATEGMRLAAYTQVYPTNPSSQHSGSDYGSIQYGGQIPTLSLGTHAVQVGVKDDLVNQFIWAVWRGGGFDIADISSLVDASALMGMELSLFSELPPVIMAGDGVDEIDVGWGDARVTATISAQSAARLISGAGMEGQVVYARQEPLQVELYLSALLGGQIQTNAQTNSLDADLPNAEAYLQVASVSDPEQVDPGLISIVNTNVGLVFEQLLPGLVENVLGSFPLPSINVQEISDLLPSIDLQLSAAEARRDGHYYVLGGDMNGR